MKIIRIAQRNIDIVKYRYNGSNCQCPNGEKTYRNSNEYEKLQRSQLKQRLYASYRGNEAIKTNENLGHRKGKGMGSTNWQK